jgi:hypothetical protein
MPTLKKVIVVAGNMTGDLFGVTTALMNDEDLGVLILREVELEDPYDEDKHLALVGVPPNIASASRHLGVKRYNPRGRCQSVDQEAFLRAALPNRGYQIHIANVDDISHWYGALTRAPKDQRLINMAYICDNAQNRYLHLRYSLTDAEDGELKKDHFMDIGYGTRLVGQIPRNDLVALVRKGWRMDDWKGGAGARIESACGDILQAKGFVPANKKYLVFWLRFSGKKGGGHPQHDTGYHGLRQLLALARMFGFGTILAGDKGWNDEHRQKLDILAEVQEVDCNLTEIWKDNDYIQGMHPFRDAENGRLLQFRLLDYVNRRSAGLVHLGMRSGNLEAYALMGHRVYYMEERDIDDRARMEAWHSPVIGKKMIGPRYDRLVIEMPPTKTGKYIVSAIRSGNRNPDNQIHPWRAKQYDNSVQRLQIKTKALEGANFAEGFIQQDLITLYRFFRDVLDAWPMKVKDGVTKWYWHLCKKCREDDCGGH